jgi:hypothetical protein
MVSITHRRWIFAAIWMIVAVATWAATVPGWLSLTTFFWLNAAGFGLAAVVVAMIRSAAPTRSVAHVLYDTEHQPTSSR